MAKVTLERPPTKAIAWSDRGQKWCRAGDLKPGDVLVFTAGLRRTHPIESVQRHGSEVIVTGVVKASGTRAPVWHYIYRDRVQIV